MRQNGLSYELIEVVVIDLRALPLGHTTVVQGENELPAGIVPHDVGMLEQIRLRQSIKVLLLHTGVRNDSVLFTKDTVDHFCVCIREVEYPGGLVVGQAEFGDQDEYLEAHCVRDVHLWFTWFPYFLGSYWGCH